MNTISIDMDPLSSYEYPYDYETIPETYPYIPSVKNEYQYNQSYQPQTKPVTETIQKPNEVKCEVKPELKKLREKKSGYWSIKIKEKDYAFYGCALCNISYSDLQLLDQHMTTHKDRITSYDLRVKNQIKRKLLKKEKKLKKKVKLEKIDNIEIKPEDGYIGEEKALNYNENLDKDKPPNTNLETHKPSDTNLETHKPSDTILETHKPPDTNLETHKPSDTNLETHKLSDTKDNNDSKLENGKKKKGKKQESEELQKIYKCFACEKQFTLSYYLRLHVRSHTDEKPYTCAECGQSFITASKLGRHNKRIHLAIRYQCRICYKFFSQFDLLTRHFDKKHPDDKLEGEPYDYNAILPYLKELEEEMKRKEESEKKIKTEDPWEDVKPTDMVTVDSYIDTENIVVPEEKLDRIPSVDDLPLAVLRDESANIKSEIDLGVDDETGHFDDTQNDNNSDEDYFPSNTWATVSPQLSPQPAQKRRPKGSLTCEICNKTISSVTYMKVHLRTHSGEKPFKCYICDRGFITSSKMHRHVLTHNDENIDSKDNIKIEQNLDTDEMKEEKPKKKKGKIKKKVKTEGPKIKEKHKKRPHSCEFCNKRFLHLATLQVHKKSHEGEVLSYKCEYCFEEFSEEQVLRQHEASHTGPKPYVCTMCGKNYKRKTTLVYHRQHHRTGSPSHACPVCPKRFHSEHKLQRHAVRHGADKYIIRYECPVCAHMFHTKYHALMHLNSHLKEGLIHEENRPEIVAMLLQNARRLPKNPNAVPNPDLAPNDERSRICNICGEIFQHFYYLEEHLKSHGSKIAIENEEKAEEKRHTCTICDKSFKLHYYLKLHSYTHSKEKPYICQQCGKGFITKGKLKRHLETHSGLKKYQCHICYKFFTRPSYLRIHVRTIHGTQDYNFRIDKGYQF